jgi:hypothetical protein
MNWPEPELGRVTTPSKGYVIEIVTGPRDDMDEWLRLFGDYDGNGEGWG